jgi:hypothetical protein
MLQMEWRPVHLYFVYLIAGLTYRLGNNTKRLNFRQEERNLEALIIIQPKSDFFLLIHNFFK